MAFFKRHKPPEAAPSAAAEHRTPTILHAPFVPLVSEKSTRLQALGQYTFSVPLGVSKVTVKKVIESTYKVRVVGVNSTRLPRKTVRRGRSVGHTRVRRHLIVRLAPGQSLELTKAA